MKYFTSLIIVALLAGGCAHKYAADVTPMGQSIDKSNQYIAALSDFQDGVSAAFYSNYLSAHITIVTALVLKDAVETIHAAPNGAKTAALAALDNIAAQLANDPQLSRFIPYLDSARTVIGSL